MTKSKLTTAYLFENGMVVAFDQHEQQMLEFQGKYTPELGKRIAEEGVTLEGMAWRGAE